MRSADNYRAAAADTIAVTLHLTPRLDGDHPAPYTLSIRVTVRPV